MGPSLLCVRQKVPRLEVQGGQHLAKYRRQQPKKQNCFFFRFSGASYKHFPFHLPGNVKTGNGKLGCAPPTPFFCPHARKISEAFVQRSGKKDGCDASTTVILTLGPLPFPLFRCTHVRPANSGFLDSRPSVGPTHPPSKRGERGFTVCIMKPSPPPGPCRKRGFYRKEVSAVPFHFFCCAQGGSGSGWQRDGWVGREKESGCCVFRGWVGMGRTGEEEEEEECTPAM